jgi:uncharacterized repeat protein (TIGR01451 family)
MKKILAATCLLLPTLALAQVELKTEIFKVVEVQKDNSNKVEWVEAKNIIPGDKVGYRINVENKGEDAADNLVLNNPIPDNTIYVDNSARGADSKIEFSVDGGKQYGLPEQLFITKEGKKLPATAKDYTHVRWTLLSPLNTGEESSVQYVVQVK